MRSQLVRYAAATFITTTCAQSIAGLGVSGGDGPHGGIGDVDHPVLTAQAFITDAIVLPTENATRLLSEGDAPYIASPDAALVCPPPLDVVIDSSARGAQQELVGFGHAWTDSTVATFATLEPEVLDQVMKDLFSQEGNNMGFMRHTIGSSDLSYNQYSFDDNGPSFNEGEPDLNLDNFTLGPDGSAMAAMIARMGQYKGDVFLYGSPWSYPGWMKSNALLVAPNLNSPNTYNILNNSFDIQYVPQMVKYFTKYLDTYKNDYGVSVNGLTLMNEPLNYQGGYPCMYLDAADEAAILTQGLGAELQQRNVLAMAYDHNTDMPAYPFRVLQRAREHVRGTAWHCYQSPVANYSVLQDLHYEYPDVLQFMTECTTYLPQPGSLNFGVPQNFIAPVQHGASGASMWVMATDPDYGPHSPYGGCAGCLGSIIVNSSTTYTKTLDYYMIGHFSRFIRRGAVNHRVLAGNVGSTADSQQLLILAARNPDQSWAVVFMNNLNSAQDIRLSFTEGGRIWQGMIPNATVVTWLLPADDRCPPPPPPSPPVYSSSSAASPPVVSSLSSEQPSPSPVPSMKSSASVASSPLTPSSTSTLSSSTIATTLSAITGPPTSWSVSGSTDSWSHGPPSSGWEGEWPPYGQPSWSWSQPTGAAMPGGYGHHWPQRDSAASSAVLSATSLTCPVTTTTSSTSSSSSSSSTTPLIPVPNTTHVILPKEL